MSVTQEVLIKSLCGTFFFFYLSSPFLFRRLLYFRETWRLNFSLRDLFLPLDIQTLSMLQSLLPVLSEIWGGGGGAENSVALNLINVLLPLMCLDFTSYLLVFSFLFYCRLPLTE